HGRADQPAEEEAGRRLGPGDDPDPARRGLYVRCEGRAPEQRARRRVTRPSSLPVLVQVGPRASLAVIMPPAVAFAVVVLAPGPRPPGCSIEAAANALKGDPAETSDGRILKRRITDRPVSQGETDAVDPVAMAISAGLA